MRKKTKLKKNILALLSIVTLNPSSACAMDAMPMLNAYDVSFLVEGKTFMKRWVANYPQTDADERRVIGNVVECRNLLTNLMQRQPELKKILQDPNSSVISSKELCAVSQPTNPNPDSLESRMPIIRSVRQNIFVVKRLCEHGSFCESCVDGAGWKFFKSYLVIRNVLREACSECIPVKIKCIKDDLTDGAYVSLSKLCKSQGKAGGESQLSDAEIRDMVRKYVSTPGNTARLLSGLDSAEDDKYADRQALEVGIPEPKKDGHFTLQ